MNAQLTRRVGALESWSGGPRHFLFKGEAQLADDALAARNAGRVEDGLPPLGLDEVAFVTFRGL